MNQIKKTLYIIAGCLSLALACLGIVAKFIPFLPFPTTPFLLLASFCFAKGSKQFDAWFRRTKIYQKYLSEYVKTGGMTIKQKCLILLASTIGITLAYVNVSSLVVRALLVIPALAQYGYFIFVIKTIKNEV